MSKKSITNTIASILQRLKNTAIQRNESFERVLSRFGIERFLYRLSISPYVDKLILKGGNLFVIWQDGTNLRATRDSDFLYQGRADDAYLGRMFAEICNIPCAEDGVLFDAASIDLQSIRKQSQYKGTNIRLMGYIGKVPVAMRFDIGVGDSITPSAEQATYPILIPNLPSPVIKTYPCYTVIAEKFEAMVTNGERNTRVKDFFDIYLLMQLREFDYRILKQAIESTFHRRKTPLPTELPICFSARYWDDPIIRHGWTALLQDNFLMEKDCPQVFEQVVRAIGLFITPILQASDLHPTLWRPEQGWMEEARFSGS